MTADAPAVRGLVAGEVYRRFSTSPRGLSAAEAAARLARYGRNELPLARRRWVGFRFLAQFTDLFAVVLEVAAATIFLAWLVRPSDIGNLQLALAILAVVVLNATIGFFQEYSAERTAEALQAMVPQGLEGGTWGRARRGAGHGARLWVMWWSWRRVTRSRLTRGLWRPMT